MACPDESALLDFGRGLLTGEKAEAVEAHIDQCPDCRALVAESLREERTPSADGLPRGEVEPVGAFAKLGRYVVLELLSAGGMGVVYSAFDPELERKVALKVLRPLASGAETPAQAQGRLLREAQSMARLSHPNVLPVFDVGAVGEQVFLAMELVEGGTLGEWLAEAPRGWREAVGVFLEAGRGLAAAHAASLVHRDFKPGNVLIGRDGRVRVTDFGLARPTLIEVRSEAEGEQKREKGVSATAGTPAYMAPEQFRGGTLDARSDQFSFCVALWEALYGERPFGGKTAAEHRDEVLAGRLKPPPASARVPAWLHQILLRGLSIEPEGRYLFMESLLDALARSQRGARLARWGIGAAAALLLASIVAVLQLGHTSAGRCAEAGKPIEDVWGSSRASGADPQLARLEAAVRQYQSEWRGVAQLLCTTPSFQVSAVLVAGRGRCLEELHQTLKALVDASDAASPGPTLLAMNELVFPRMCLTALDADRRWPELSPVARSLAEGVARAQARSLLGHENDAAPLAAKAHEAGLPRLEARALLAAANSNPSVDRLQEALLVAEGARDALLGAQAWEAILRLQARSDAKAAKLSARHALALLAAAGGDAGLEARVEVSLARALEAASENGAAVAAADRAISLADAAFPENHVVRAEAHAVRAAVSIGSAGIAGDNALRAAQQMEGALGLATPRTGAFLLELGDAVLRVGRAYDARKIFEKAHAAAVAAHGEKSAEAAQALTSLAQTELVAVNPKAALERSKQAQEIYESLFGEQSGLLTPALVASGEALRLQARCEEALPVLRRALELRPKDQSARAAAYLGSAKCEQEMGRAAPAIGLLNQALGDVPADLDAELKLELGRTLWDHGVPGDRPRARALVDESLPRLPRSAQVEAQLWLGAHALP